MKKLFISFIAIVGLLFTHLTMALATRGVIATDDEMKNLKSDLRLGKLSVEKTRLNDIRDNYGDAPAMNQDDRHITYEYGEFALEFIKEKYWRSWEYDSFREPAYTDDIDDLRFDLESEEIVGKNVTMRKFVRDYGLPTEMCKEDEDGTHCNVYYGDIKLVFENVIMLKSWRVKNFLDTPVEEVLETKSAPKTETKPAAKAEAKSK